MCRQKKCLTVIPFFTNSSTNSYCLARVFATYATTVGKCAGIWKILWALPIWDLDFLCSYITHGFQMCSLRLKFSEYHTLNFIKITQ